MEESNGGVAIDVVASELATGYFLGTRYLLSLPYQRDQPTPILTTQLNRTSIDNRSRRILCQNGFHRGSDLQDYDKRRSREGIVAALIREDRGELFGHTHTLEAGVTS